jgi:hypothetical protein
MIMDPKSQPAADAANSSEHKSQTATPSSMDELFQRLPAHVRIVQRRGVTTGIVGYPSSPN